MTRLLFGKRALTWVAMVGVCWSIGTADVSAHMPVRHQTGNQHELIMQTTSYEASARITGDGHE